MEMRTEVRVRGSLPRLCVAAACTRRASARRACVPVGSRRSCAQHRSAGVCGFPFTCSRGPSAPAGEGTGHRGVRRQIVSGRPRGQPLRSAALNGGWGQTRRRVE